MPWEFEAGKYVSSLSAYLHSYTIVDAYRELILSQVHLLKEFENEQHLDQPEPPFVLRLIGDIVSLYANNSFARH